jgi:hypothetical protein
VFVIEAGAYPTGRFPRRPLEPVPIRRAQRTYANGYPDDDDEDFVDDDPRSPPPLMTAIRIANRAREERLGSRRTAGTKEQEDREHITRIIEVMQLLIEAKANPNEDGPWSNSMLTEAALIGKTEILEFLYKNGTRVRDDPGSAAQALIMAITHSEPSSVEWLLSKGVNPNHMRHSKERHYNEATTPLCHAVARWRTTIYIRKDPYHWGAALDRPDDEPGSYGLGAIVDLNGDGTNRAADSEADLFGMMTNMTSEVPTSTTPTTAQLETKEPIMETEGTSSPTTTTTGDASQDREEKAKQIFHLLVREIPSSCLLSMPLGVVGVFI